jgi:hypothetical protein
MRSLKSYFFVLTTALWLLAQSAWAQQTCSTTKAGLWSDPSIWSCNSVPNGDFTGTINVTHAILFPDYYTIRMTNQVTLNVTGAGSLDFGSGAGAGTKLELLNINSSILLGSSSNFITGGNNQAIVNVGGKYCNGPFNGKNGIIEGARIVTFNAPACANAQLPVTLLSFDGKPIGDQVQISWSTTSEQNASFFDVQRSANLSEFLTIGSIKAKGTTDQRQYYGFLDAAPLSGNNYYRLMQVDFDGATTVSKPIAVVMDNSTPSFALLGNPAQGQSLRVAPRNLTNASYRLTTLAGREVSLSQQLQADGTLLLTPAQPLSAGQYLLRAELGSARLVQKVIIP